MEIRLPNDGNSQPIINDLFQFVKRNLVFGITLESQGLRLYHIRGEHLVSPLVRYLEGGRESKFLDSAQEHLYSDVIGSLRHTRSVVLVREGDDRIVILYNEVTSAHNELLEKAKTLSIATSGFALAYSRFVPQTRSETACQMA